MGLRVNPHRELSFHFCSETLLQSPGPGTLRTTTIPRLSPSAVRSVVSGQLHVRSEGHLCAGVHLLQQDLGEGGAPAHLGVEGVQRHSEGRRAVRVSPQPGH